MQSIIDQTIPILQKYGITKASLFGSYAKNNFDQNSDVDILIQPPKNMGLSFINLHLELENKLNKKVDLVSYNGINKHLRSYILENQIKII
ncbi:MAG: hypothetical protein AUJ41_00550 [Candidatus Pacebacteria bacterium CG1_02_43_31]|nr:hypothetical protein [Candidatus Pacearchaeota archaeon]OIO45239.1 MAG: hypothetical protein AUJ41_00550 [Candidatus Pacebacteria bacterium CG1_02_43_31]